MNRNQVLPQITLSSEPKQLSAVDFQASQTYVGHGFLGLGDLPRLAAEVAQIEPDDGFYWEIRTFFESALGGDPRQKMHLRLFGRIHLICQRCMKPCPVSIDEERWFVFVADEAQADAFPMEDDEQEPLVISAHFDLLATMEDEVLLSLPLIPKHPEGACRSSALVFPSNQHEEPDTGVDAKPENPFNILKNMKKSN